MSERHLDCSSEEVRAILEGRKTQTRQVIKLTEFQPCKMSGGSEWIFRDKHDCWNDVSAERLLEKYCPYKIGMKLWVRETFSYSGFGSTVTNQIIYRADGEQYDRTPVWRSRIFMPRWASRIALEIVSIRVQRVQEISLSDIRDEGLTFFGEIVLNDHLLYFRQKFEDDYRKLWDSLNAKRGYSWQSNPGVWALGLKVVTK